MRLCDEAAAQPNDVVDFAKSGRYSPVAQSFAEVESLRSPEQLGSPIMLPGRVEENGCRGAATGVDAALRRNPELGACKQTD
jgi:hypothetical protein